MAETKRPGGLQFTPAQIQANRDTMAELKSIIETLTIMVDTDPTLQEQIDKAQFALKQAEAMNKIMGRQ